jgi:hypothetical protein
VAPRARNRGGLGSTRAFHLQGGDPSMVLGSPVRYLLGTINGLRAWPALEKYFSVEGGSDSPAFRSTVVGNPFYARGRLPHAE